MATAGHVLTATDTAFKAYIDAGSITGLSASSVVVGKFYLTKTLPVAICAATRAERRRAKNWEVTGQIIIRSDTIDADTGDVSADQVSTATTMETAVLDRLELNVPNDDQPITLAAAVTSAAVAAGVVLSTDFLMTACFIKSVSAGFVEDLGVWELTVDYLAQVVA